MAIVLDQRAQGAIARRRAHGQEASILLRLATVPVRGMHHLLLVGWYQRCSRQGALLVWPVGDVLVYVEARVARYARWHDVTISAQHVGPIHRLTILQATLTLLRMLEWEQAHPAGEH